MDDAENAHLYSLSCRIYLMIALAYEKSENFELTNYYLNKAYKNIKTTIWKNCTARIVSEEVLIIDS